MPGVIDGNAIVERILAPAYIGSCLILGGSSSAGILANTILQIAGVVILATCAWRPGAIWRPATRELLALVAIVAGCAAISLVPLPPALSAELPGRAMVATGYRLLGSPVPALPLSLAPDATIRALLSVIPPAAMLVTTLRSTPEGRRDAVFVICGLAMISVVLGLLQQLTGFNSRFYVYEITSRGGAPGLFANRNHQATLSLMAMPLVAGVARELADGLRTRSARVGLLAGCLGAFSFLAIAVVIMQSIAGWLLLLPTIVASVLVYVAPVRLATARWLAGGAALALVAAVALVALFGQLGTRVSADEMQPRQRVESMSLTLRAARDYFPLGSGLGSFQNVYPSYEAPERATHTYVNHAHNDYAEVALEAGLAGIVIVLAFILWWGRLSYRLWSAASERDALARAACVSLAVVMAHSAVDYPMRTSAVAAAAALCCALMIERRNLSSRLHPTHGRTQRWVSPSRPAMVIGGRA